MAIKFNIVFYGITLYITRRNYFERNSNNVARDNFGIRI